MATTAKGNVFDQYKCIELYDALDHGKYGLVVEKADVLLQQGALPLASALKTVALFRLGRRDDAERESHRLLAGNVDLNVLKPLEYVLPRIGMARQLADLYMAASNAYPQDEELADGAMLVLVKAEMFQRALQVVLKQYRTHKNVRDFWRYIQLAILQAQRVKPSAAKLTLDIALRLCKEQALDEHEFTSETLSLYLHFFALQDAVQLRDALGVLSKPANQDIVEKNLGIQFQVRDCWKLLGDQQSLLDDCRKRIASGDRNWAVISQFADATVKVAQGALSTDFVQVLVDAAEHDKWSERGSFLGVLELCRLAKESNVPIPSNLDYPKLILEYAMRFKTTLTCFDDVRPYLSTLGAAQRDTIVASIKPSTSLTSDDSIKQRINAEKMSLFFEKDKPESAADDLMLAYIETLEHVRLPSTEMQPGDDIALLGIYTQMETAPDVPGLMRAAALASYVCEESEKAYKVRLVLIRLLLRLGCPRLAMHHFEALGLKAVQLDTVSHYMLDRNASFGGAHAAEVGNLWESNIRDFYNLSSFEVPEAMGRAFLNGKFSQVSDLCDFHDSIEGSYARLILLIDMIHGKLAMQDLVDAERESAIETVNNIVALINAQSTFGSLTQKQWVIAMLEVISIALDTSTPSMAASLDEGVDTSQAASMFLESTLRLLTAEIRTGVTQATVSFDQLHAAWTGVKGLRLLQLQTEQAKKVCTLVVYMQNQKDVFGPGAGDALKHICETLTKSMDEPVGVNLANEFKSKNLGALAKSSTGFTDKVASARKDAFKDAVRPYQTILPTVG